MDYELAKQLKDAGFPQRARGLHYTQSVGHPQPFLAEGSLFMAKEGWQYSDTYVPSLEELIDACHDRFGGVIRGGEQKADGNRFTAFQDAITVLADKNIAEDNEVPHAEGATPIEAVARLFLALHANAGAGA